MAEALTVAPPSVRVSVVIPCLDEAETISECVTAAREVLDMSRRSPANTGVTGVRKSSDQGRRTWRSKSWTYA